MNNLLSQIKKKKIDFVIVNGENADLSGSWFNKRYLWKFF